jgi:hypothetical protein
MMDYGYLRVDNLANYAYVGNGTGTTAPEKFIGYNPLDPGSPASITAGGYVLLRSMQTGLWCRLAVYNGTVTNFRRGKASLSRGLLQVNSTTIVWGMLGDQPTAATATQFIYSRRGLVYLDTAMVAQAMFYPLLWSNQTVLPGTSNISVNTLPTCGWCSGS